jgi:hypothetical protein
MARGSRPGERRGGRAKGTRNRATREIREIIDSIIPAKERIQLLAQLARGVTVEHASGIVYKLPPDLQALKILEEYATGRPVQRVVASTSEGQPLPVLLMPT